MVEVIVWRMVDVEVDVEGGPERTVRILRRGAVDELDEPTGRRETNASEG
jgi:hypothetical protein